MTRDHKGVERLALPRTHSKRVMQHSKFLLQGWRANADLEILIYRSNPSMPDMSEIDNVCQYVMSYVGKRYQTTKAEKDVIYDVING